MRKTMIALATIALSLGVVQMLAGTGAGAASPKRPVATVLRFSEGFCSVAGSHCKVVGDRTNPTAWGNRLIFTIPLSSGGNPIGYEQGECVYLHEASRSDYCTYDLHLPAGVVSVQGTLPITSERSRTIPVTGGTRAYLGAYGTLTLIANTFDYRLRVLTP